MGIVKGKKQAENPDTNSRAIGSAGEPIQGAIGAINDGEQPVIDNSELAKWLLDENWGQPSWLKNPQMQDSKSLENNYQASLKNSLRWRYMRLEGDFRTALNNFYHTTYIDKITALRVVDFLNSARQSLEQDNYNALDVKNLLDMTDQYMVWLYPPHVAFPIANALCAELKAKNHVLAGFLETEIANAGGTNLGAIRTALDKVVGTLNQENQTTQLNNGLQIARLQMLLKWGIFIFIILLIGVPLLVHIDEKVFENTILGKMLPSFQPWVAMVTLAIVGSVGAFLSGLMQVRKTKINLEEFKENVIQFKLRPLVGATFAIVIAALLSWNLISGIEIKNAGVYILIAFLCGFSERFFLSLLQIDEEGNNTRAEGTPLVSAQNARQVTPPEGQ